MSLADELGTSATTQAVKARFREKLERLEKAKAEDLTRRLRALSDADWTAMGRIWDEFGEPETWTEEELSALQVRECRLMRDNLGAEANQGAAGTWSWGLRLRALRALRSAGEAFVNVQDEHGSRRLPPREPAVDEREVREWAHTMGRSLYGWGRP